MSFSVIQVHFSLISYHFEWNWIPLHYFWFSHQLQSIISHWALIMFWRRLWEFGIENPMFVKIWLRGPHGRDFEKLGLEIPCLRKSRLETFIVGILESWDRKCHVLKNSVQGLVFIQYLPFTIRSPCYSNFHFNPI